MQSTILSQIGQTPLVPLLSISQGLPNPIWAKCEHLNPSGSIKDRIALAIVDDAEASGRLQPGTPIIEATAGNTGLGLALIAAVRGYQLICTMPEKMSLDKERALRAVGAEVLRTPNCPPDDPGNFQRVAERLAQEKGYFLADQFRNQANPAIHENTTGPELLADLKNAQAGDIGAFVSGVGTGGTLTGVGRCLRKHAPGAKVILADPAGSRLAHLVKHGSLGEDGRYAVEGIGISQPPEVLDVDLIDDAVTISDDESFSMARRLIQEEGLLVGGSSGTNVAAAVAISKCGGIDGPIVTILCDSWDRYFSQPWLQKPQIP